MTTHPRLEIGPGRLFGAIICESIRPGSAGLRGVDLSLRSLNRYDVAGRSPDQPPIWTLLEFDGRAESADDLASQLAASLLEELGWYANFSTAKHVYVVFAGKVFRYERESPVAGREEAEAYARSKGVPEPQLDWGE